MIPAHEPLPEQPVAMLVVGVPGAGKLPSPELSQSVSNGRPASKTKISNLLTQAEQVACFRNAARRLTPGDRFAIELWVPELRRLPPGQQATVFSSEPGYIGLDTYDGLWQRIDSHHLGFGEGKQVQLFRSAHRYIWPAELDLMAQLAGSELETRHADWAGQVYRRVHRRVAVARFGLPTPDRVRASVPLGTAARRGEGG